MALLAGPAAGEAAEPAAPTAPEAPETKPASPRLEDLLKLPDSIQFGVERRGGATRGEWRERFQGIRSELATERESLERSKRELEEVATSADSWKLAPPGAGNLSDAPLDYRLRNQIRQHQAEVDRLEKRLGDLEVEANLAGVPEDWRE